MINREELYMQRCFDLARLGKTRTSPNPIVGALLLNDGKIIGEGYHEKFGFSHAEVNAVNSVTDSNKPIIKDSELFVSLEPCNIVGNTPACTNLIIKEQISKVNLSVIDKTEGVNHSGIDKLRSHNIDVQTDVLEQEGARLAGERNTFVSKKRPYIILKWAESADGFMGQNDKQVWLTNDFSKRLVHKWRSESTAIMVGTNTAATDNPTLTTRLYPGSSPLRIVIDKSLKLEPTMNIFNKDAQTWVMNDSNDKHTEHIRQIKVPVGVDYIDHLCAMLFEENKSSLLIEGGRKLLNAFVARGLWDEIRCFKTNTFLGNGILAPLIYLCPDQSHQLGDDCLNVFFNKHY